MESVNVNVAAEIEISLPKVEGSLVVNVAALPEEIRAKIFTYGLQQKLSDSCSQLKSADYKEAADFEAVIRKTVGDCLDKLMRGNWREGGGGRTVDPVEAECRAIIIAKLMSGGVKKADATARVTKEGWTKIVTAGVIQAVTKAGKAADGPEAIAAVEKAIKAIRSSASDTVAKRAAIDFDF